jgi:hypothetical protein
VQGKADVRFVKTKELEKREGRMPIRTVKITAEQREELIQLCRQYSDLQKKAVEIRCALNDQVAALAGLVEIGEVAGLSIDFTQIEIVSVAEWNEALLNVTASERWVCTGFAPTEADLRARKMAIETTPSVRPQAK